MDLFFVINVLHQLTAEKRLDRINLSGKVRPKKRLDSNPAPGQVFYGEMGEGIDRKAGVPGKRAFPPGI